MKPCRKRRYPNQTAAVAAKIAIDNCMLQTYRCASCKAWHLGRTRDPGRTIARIDQILAQHAAALARRLKDRNPDT